MDTKTNYEPFFDRDEHKYVHSMSDLISRAKVIIKDAIQVLYEIEATTDKHISDSLKRKRKEDSNEAAIS